MDLHAQKTLSEEESSEGWPEPTVSQPTELEHAGTIIMLHGRGSSGYDFSFEIQMTWTSDRKAFAQLLPKHKFIFPTCPPRYASSFGQDITQWYDMASLSYPEKRADDQVCAIKEAIEYLWQLVEQEAKLSPTGGVILGGISQGFSIVVLAVLMGMPHVSAVIGFSSWLPFQSELVQCTADETEDARKKLKASQHLNQRLRTALEPRTDGIVPPVFLGHCSNDHVVDIGLGHYMEVLLSNLGFTVTWNENEDGGHWIQQPDGMDAVAAFILGHVANP